MVWNSNILELYCLKELVSQNSIDERLIRQYKAILSKYINGHYSLEQCKELVMKLDLSLNPLLLCLEILATDRDDVPVFTCKKEEKTYSKKRFVCTWSDYEDKRLVMAVHKYGTKDYELVAKYVGNNRTKSQCSQRWERTLNPCIDKSAWTEEEEEILVKAVEKYGTKAWTSIANCLQTRTDVQCRYHYKHVLNGNTPKALKLRNAKEQAKRAQYWNNDDEFFDLIDKVLVESRDFILPK
ncbi:Myb-like DNA-binding domain containing protein [Trichomonas vaginalis G3]|uniref:Myb-like DNA-binding domain containing protein n=1 Tax=Trichomonas vaginalis (strain ATCC PRA-98 / G3) TaxID=412133 RepID=A2F6J6_TRIV3|nr:RNA polymerase II transcription regulator recruiting protein [Trichomonas vaginalis G3]EAX99494.1 Myb-like DNA-binding domain containing protein [Trichomonas vaginalis G3]KAI5538682.1 RNA polymerase II transcription regulator recruiting protein [Trichomonas vaginalis G3]|eukprot:XP_001312424.1 Myb-like DNA-binding domain containing protein [Trichomonas vaginalis G3]